ncbi:hypothetical protein AK812_SmicGene49116 [Symbiodinium microadriaticum]|uniref:Uncharacterized protein n=1 Tax=Symbiodinium microadriaticum TaxID=2951 RepID=A0A1Q9E629_SYMMI|nr:hypothetical protein AK812_SmicGene49116 [Symbiodinium microadriaticum]CAE7806063.1 unnamed protein product [Symbiodinium sp. KB8]
MASNSFTRALWWALPFLLLVVVLSCATVFPDILEGLGIGALMQCVSSESTRNAVFPCRRPIRHAVVQETWWLPKVSTRINDLMAEDGPLLPYLLLVMQLYTSTVEKSAPKSAWWCPWWCVVVVCWAAMTAVRMVIFLCVHPYNFYFSDHIFLLNSMMAQIQMSLAMTIYRRESCPGPECWYFLEVTLAWALVFLTLVEAFMTAWLYHTCFASWLALLVSTIIFQSTACIFRCLLRCAPIDEKRSKLINGDSRRERGSRV